MARKRRRNRQRTKDMAAPPMPMREGETPMPMGQGQMPMGQGMGQGMMQGMGAPAEQAPEQGAEGEEAPNVTPEEQALYHKFMENYYTVMYVGEKGSNGEMQPPLADELRSEYFSGDMPPTDAVANAGVVVVKNLADSAANSGKQMPGDVLMHAATNEIIPDLAELAENSNFHQFTQEELDVSLYKAMDLYQRVAGDSLNMQEMENDYNEMVQADKEGRLDEVLPGASEAAARMPKQDPAQQQAAQQPAAPAQPMPAGGPQPGMGRA